MKRGELLARLVHNEGDNVDSAPDLHGLEGHTRAVLKDIVVMKRQGMGFIVTMIHLRGRRFSRVMMLLRMRKRVNDRLADRVALPHAEAGDLVAIFCAGAYGLTASPARFLGHPEPVEMLVGG